MIRDLAPVLNGGVFISGGLGGIGQMSCAWAAAAGAPPCVWLLGRSGRAPQSMSFLLGACGHSSINAISTDVAVHTDMAGVLHVLAGSSSPSLRTVLHAGAQLHDAVISKQTAGTMRAVLSPKACGARLLLGAAAGMPLQGMVHYSSLTAHLGNHGQSNYAAANGALETMSQQSMQCGLWSTCVLWGPWSIGMALDNPGVLARLLHAGIAAIDGEWLACGLEAAIVALRCMCLAF